MSWSELALAALNVFQAVALAWITLKQAQVKADLQAHNGDQAAAIANLRAALRQHPSA